MKKILSALVLALTVAFTATAAEGFAYGVWFNSPKETKTTDVEGVCIGVPVIDFNNLSGLSLALCGNRSNQTTGIEYAMIGFNKAESLEGFQLSFVNLAKGQHGDYAAQLGLYNQCSKNGVQLGLINNSKDNATFQLGLININKNGMFPAMIFVNFGKNLFD